MRAHRRLLAKCNQTHVSSLHPKQKHKFKTCRFFSLYVYFPCTVYTFIYLLLAQISTTLPILRTVRGFCAALSGINCQVFSLNAGHEIAGHEHARLFRRKSRINFCTLDIYARSFGHGQSHRFPGCTFIISCMFINYSLFFSLSVPLFPQE